MAGHSDTQCKTEIRRDISDSLLRDECFVQPIICFAKFRGLYLYLHFRFVLIRGVHFVYVTLWLANVLADNFESLESVSWASLLEYPEFSGHTAKSLRVAFAQLEKTLSRRNNKKAKDFTLTLYCR